MLAVLLTVSSAYSSLTDTAATTLNLLKPPNYPAVFLLGLDPESVERPQEPMELAISIVNATDTLRVLPRGYALEFAPSWVFCGRNISYEDFRSPRIGPTLFQTFSISAATSSESDTLDSLTTSAALGVRFSLMRGKMDPAFENDMDSLGILLGKLGTLINSRIVSLNKTDSTIRALDSLILQATTDKEERRLIALRKQRGRELAQEAEKNVEKGKPDLIKTIDHVSSGLQLRRIGWKLGLSGAVALNAQRGGGLEDIAFHKAGGWINFGYEDREWSALGVLRYMMDSIDPDQTGVDIGIKGISDKPEQRLSWSTEGVYRWLTDANSYLLRLSATINYKLESNALISFTFGRELGPNSNKPIGSVNLALGFGGKRQIQ
ncbi:hypothetical protein KAX06_00050 [candidate division WOR-3 bacterium]|nr:hypothetical protein [candidate division WOR-3 bacterium]